MATNGHDGGTDLEANPLFSAPMQLCRPSACHTFLEVVPETLRALQDISLPIVMVAGVGSQRIGKSTILNLLHSRRTSGFGLGHTLDAKTTGIWIWMRKHPKDPRICVCLADTEGLDTPHIAQSYNWMLSSLTVLISSVFLYQSKSTIDSSATDRLSTILAVSEQMVGNDDSSVTSKPYFVWVLRDMQLQMKSDPKTEMMEKLETGHIRKMKRSFREFDCFALPRPVDKEEELQDVEKMEFTALKKNFQEEFFLFDRFVMNLADKAPMYGSSVVTGSVLGELVTRYIDAIRDRKGLLSSITELPSQAKLIAQMSAEKALKDGKASYNKAMDGLMPCLPLSLADIYQEHHKALAEAEKIIVDAAVGVDESDMQGLHEQLRAYALDEQSIISLGAHDTGFTTERQVRGRLLPVLEKNKELSHETSHKLWQHAYTQVAAGVQASPCAYGSVKEYDEAVAACKQSLMEGANGSGTRHALERYLAASKQLKSDRETVMNKMFSCQLSAVQESARKQVEAMEEVLKSQLSMVKQELEGALEKEKTERLALQSLLRQEMADSMRQERDQRQGLHEMLLKEQLERTQAMADVKTALVHEGSERANSIGELRTELQASDKGVANLRLETQEKVNAVRESVTALDTKILAVDHEAQNRENKLSERLQAVDGNTRDLLSQLQEHDAKTNARIEGISKTLASTSSGMDSRLSALENDLSSLQSASDDMGSRVSQATSAASAAADAADAAKHEASTASEKTASLTTKMKELEKQAVDMNKKALDAAAAATAAKFEMEKAAATAISSAYREMDRVFEGPGQGKNQGEAGAAAPGETIGYQTRVREFIKKLNF